MKISILLTAGACLLLQTADAQKRLVLYEEFTSETCPPSRAADSLLWKMLNKGDNPDNIEYITYITPVPAKAALYNTDIPDYDLRTAYYKVPFVSYGRIDGLVHDKLGGGLPSVLKQDTLDTEVACPPAFDLSPQCIMLSSYGSFSIAAHITCLSDFAPSGASMKLRCAYVRSLDYSMPPGTNGQTHFEHIVRKMYPGALGTVIDSVWTAGDTATVHLSGYLPSEAYDSVKHPHTSGPGFFVLWIQNDKDLVVAQTARCIPLELSSLNIPEHISGTGDLAIFPNPASGQATLSFELKSSTPVTISIRDHMGRQVFARSKEYAAGTQYVPISLSEMPGGLYMVSVQAGDMFVTRSIIVKK